MINRPSSRLRVKDKVSAHAGFTLVELIVVILLIAILGITVLPKLQGTNEYQLVSHRDQFISLLRTVQMRAMQNTQDDATTCHRVRFLADSAGLSAQNSSTGQCDAGLIDISSNPNADFLIIDETANYSAINGQNGPISFLEFDSWGRPSTDVGTCFRRCQIVIETYSVCIESEGYIYACP